jgi:argininosuccinate synthase
MYADTRSRRIDHIENRLVASSRGSLRVPGRYRNPQGHKALEDLDPAERALNLQAESTQSGEVVYTASVLALKER